jgi:hypothetical protein
MAYQFHEFGNMPPLGAENVVDKVYQLFVLAPPLRVTETEHFVRRTTLSYTRHSQIGQTTLHTIQQSDAEPFEICTGRICDLLTPVAVTCYSCVKRRSPAANLVLTKHYSPSASADANRLSIHTSMEKCLLVEVLDGLKNLDDVRWPAGVCYA